LLNLKNFRVVEASDGEQGVRFAQSEVPDLILMDLNMPVMDGFEAMKLIRSSEKTSHIPIVVISAHCWEFDWKKRVLDAGAVECLDKPIDLPIIEALLRRHF
jgi:CheY-like chemotaxis protein